MNKWTNKKRALKTVKCLNFYMGLVLLVPHATAQWTPKATPPENKRGLVWSSGTQSSY